MSDPTPTIRPSTAIHGTARGDGRRYVGVLRDQRNSIVRTTADTFRNRRTAFMAAVKLIEETRV